MVERRQSVLMGSETQYTIPFQYKKVFTAEECAELMQTFKNYDKKKDCTISKQDFPSVLKDMGRSDVTKQVLENVFKQYDRNGDGVIDYFEYLDMFVVFKAEKNNYGQLSDGGETSMIAGAVGSFSTYQTEELNVITLKFNSALEGDQWVADRLPMKNQDLFDAMSDGMMLIRLLNLMEKDCIDMRTVNKDFLSIFTVRENINLALTSAKGKIKLIGIDASAFLQKKPHLILGVCWQIARSLSVQAISLANCPQISRLLLPGEELSTLLKQTAEQMLVRWINYHLKASGQTIIVANLGKDLMDSKALLYVLNQLDKSKCPLSAIGEQDDLKRAQSLIKNADSLGVAHVMSAADFIKANTKANTIFVAEIFNKKHGLEELNQQEKQNFDSAGLVDDDKVAGSREERQFRLWINSLDIPDVFVNNLYEECKDGSILLKVIHKINDKVVDWKRVEKNPNNVFKMGINCNVALDACKALGIKLIGIGAQDILDANKKLLLAVVWQLVRIHYLIIIGSKTEKDIIDWANNSVTDVKITSFRDKALQNGTYLIKLCASIEPRVVDWALVTKGETDEDRMMNAKYAISIAKKLGACIFMVWDDVVELNQKMLLIFIASLYDLKIQSGN